MRRILLIALAALAVLLVVNAIVSNRETEPAEATADGQVVDLPGGDLHVRDVGPRNAPVTVLLHCYTCAIDYWQRLEPLLVRNGQRVVSIDLLGHGDSEKPRDGYDVESQADLVAGALERLDVDDALAAGQSLGGEIVTGLAVRHPDLLRGVVVMDSGPAEGYASLPFTARLAYVPVLGQAVNRIVPDFAIRDSLEQAFHEGFDVPDEFVDDVRAMTYSSFKSIHSQANDFIEAEPLDERLAKAGLPLLVIFGAEDRIVEPEAADEYRKVPGARVVLLPGIGHTPQMEAPVRTANLIESFDRRIAQQANPVQKRGAKALAPVAQR